MIEWLIGGAVLYWLTKPGEADETATQPTLQNAGAVATLETGEVPGERETTPAAEERV